MAQTWEFMCGKATNHLSSYLEIPLKVQVKLRLFMNRCSVRFPSVSTAVGYPALCTIYSIWIVRRAKKGMGAVWQSKCIIGGVGITQ